MTTCETAEKWNRRLVVRVKARPSLMILTSHRNSNLFSHTLKIYTSRQDVKATDELSIVYSQ